MAVFRVERTNNYTVMSNYHLRDKTLSLKAKGLLSLMLSLPETWDYTLSGLARISLEGKDAIRAAVVELEKAGYIQRGQTTDKAGKFSGNEYIIREYPTAQAPSLEEPSSENPTTEKPATGSTQTGNTSPVFPTQINIDNQIPDLSSKESFPFPSSPPAPAVGPKEAKGKRQERRNAVSKSEMDGYRALIRENIGYNDFVQERPYDAAQLDEMVELIVEAVCSRTICHHPDLPFSRMEFLPLFSGVVLLAPRWRSWRSIPFGRSFSCQGQKRSRYIDAPTPARVFLSLGFLCGCLCTG